MDNDTPLLLDVSDVVAITRLSRSKVYELAKCNSFPRPVVIPGTRSARWLRADIEAWAAGLLHVGENFSAEADVLCKE
jgi:predicted DNA-binding transcriptional regulator AlpA